MADIASDRAWTIRVRLVDGAARAYASTSSFDVGSQANLQRINAQPSAVEYLLGALGADLALGLRQATRARGVAVDDLELSLSGRLDNPLVQAGVIGEEGHAGLASVVGTAYLTVDTEPSVIDDAWREALDRSPVFQTLSRSTDVSIVLRIIL